MPYPEMLIAPMRGEMTAMGAVELKTAAQVDDAVRNARGTLMIVVNSVCGCAAGKARPGIAMAMRHTVRPDGLATVVAALFRQFPELPRRQPETVAQTLERLERVRPGVSALAAGLIGRP